MESSLTAISEVRQLKVWRADARLHGGEGEKKPPAAETAAEIKTAPQAQAELPAKGRVEFDPPSGRFVQSLLDAETQEILSRYPREGVLVFSRAISAYLRAQRESR